MWAMVVKEFRQLMRDPRTLGLLVGLPILLLCIFGYAANFNVSSIPSIVTGPHAHAVAATLPRPFVVERVEPSAGYAAARRSLQDGSATVAFVTSSAPGVLAVMDGTQFYAVQAARAALAHANLASRASGSASPAFVSRVLFDPQLKTSWIVIPGLVGLILLFIGALVTSLGVVRERQSGTMEQLAVMPFRPSDVIVGKVLPYLLSGAIDMVIIVLLARGLFNVPFAGNVATFALGSLLFLLVTLGMGVLISTVSQNQGQAVQLAIMFVVPQILLSGWIFPVSGMAPVIRWIAHALPLMYFNEISRGVMLKAEPLHALALPLIVLAGMAALAFGGAILRFRRDLVPARARARRSLSPSSPS
jgi:ABC-2 type transport system permease protein